MCITNNHNFFYMKIKFIIVIFLSGASFFLLTECKKKKVGSEISGNQPFTPEYINGEFLISKAYVVSGDSLIPSELRNFAIFTDSLVKDPNIKLEKSNDMGEVFLNEVKLVKSGDASSVFYEDATQNSTRNIPQKWTITGKGNFKGFTFENYNDFPTYIGFKNLPDTLFVGLDNILRIEGYSADFVQVTI